MNTPRIPMTFQPGSHDLAGGVSYDDALQLFLQSSNNQLPLEPVNYSSQTSSTPHQPFEYDYTRIRPQAFSEDPLRQQPPPESNPCQQKVSDEIVSTLDELKQGIKLIQTKCDNLAVTISELQDWTKTSIDGIKEYIEHHRAWSLIFKQAVENQIRDRAADSEDSAVESQGG